MTTAEQAPKSNGAAKGRFFGVVRKILGIICVVIGTIGLALPVIQGIALIALGFVLLGKKEYFHVVLDFCRKIGRKCGFGKERGEQRKQDTESV
jgi:hypothetical protein